MLRISSLFLAVAKKRSLKVSELGISKLSVVGFIIVLNFFFPSVNVFLIRFVNGATCFFNSVKECIVGFFKEKEFVKTFAVWKGFRPIGDGFFGCFTAVNGNIDVIRLNGIFNV